MENPKMNDWFATRLLNNDKSIDFLLSEGINTANSELQDRDFYKNKNKVQAAFKREDGKFDEDAFNAFYDNISKEYTYLSAIDTENFILNAYEKAGSNFSTNFGTVIKPEISISKVANPLKQSKGITELNELSAPVLSKREAAQKNQYWDNDTNTWSDKTVNEAGVLGLLKGKSLAYAIWDEDGTHIDKMTGQEVRHNAGDWKTDEFGNYYTETVDDEDSVGKQFITWSEVVTDDESPWNKIDIFDSDSSNQNIPRTVLKALAIGGATLLAPEAVASTIFYSTAAINLARVLPQISKSILSFLGSDDVSYLNKWDNTMRRFGRSTSDYSQEHFFALENILNMAIDSYMQLGQQRAIATIPKMFTSTKEAEKTAQQIAGLTAIRAKMQKGNVSDDFIANLVKGTKEYRDAEAILNNATKVSSAISRAYLVATSVDDVYNQAKEYGFDNQTAGMISLATYGIMGALFQTDYMRSILYNADDYELSRNIKTITRKYLENNNKAILKETLTAANDETKKSVLKKWGDSFSKFLQKNVLQSDLGRFSIARGALGEGIEETIEEIGQDVSMEIGRAWQSLKELYTGKEYSNEYNYFNTNPLYRYTSSFIGGAIGGGVFKLADRFKFDKTAFNNWKTLLESDNTELINELVKYTAQGKKDIVLKAIDDLQASNMFSNTISAITGMATTDENESINTVLFGNLRKAINDIDTFLRQDNLVVDPESFGNIEILKGLRAAYLKDSGLVDSLSKDFFNRASEIVSIKSDIQSLSNALPDNAKEEDVEANKQSISKLKEILKTKVEEIHRLMDGNDDSYIGRLMLETNKDTILNNIIPTTKDGIAKNMYGVSYDALPKRYQGLVDKEIENRKNSGQTEINYIEAWNVYKTLSSNDKIKTNIDELSKRYSSYISDKDISDGLKLLIAAWMNEHERDDKKNPKYKSEQIGLLIYEGLGKDKYIFPKDKNSDAKVDDSLNLDNINNIDDFINTVTSSRNQVIDKINQNPELKEKVLLDLSNNKKPAELSDEEALYLQISEDDINRAKDILINLYRNERSADRLAPSPIPYINIDGLLKNITSLLGENVDVVKIITDNNDAIEKLGNNYLINDDILQSFNKVRRILSVLRSIVNGSDENFSNDVLGVPFGANNYLNEAFRQSGAGIDLSIMNSNAVNMMNDFIDNIEGRIQTFIDLDAKNRGSVIETEKKIGIKYNELKIQSIYNLFINSSKHSSFDALRDLLKDWNVEIKDMSTLNNDDEYISLNAYYRNKLSEFESIFYNFFNGLNDVDKANFIKDLKEELPDSNIISDTSSINAELVNGDKKKTINDATIWWYLGSILLTNNDDVLKSYIDIIKNDNLFPFDSQEDIIINISKFITASDNDFENFKKWFVDTIQDYDKDNSKVKNILKVICSGGVGKTSAILNLVSKINNSLNSKKTIYSANTVNQIESLKKNVSSSDDNFVSISSIISDLNNDEKAFIDKYSNSIIIIDECTNISRKDIEKLDDIAEKNNIRIVMVGDTTQYGIDDNIDFVIAPATIQLTDSKRSYTDISRLNNAIFSNIIHISPDNTLSIDLNELTKIKWKYYESEDRIEGVKFESGKKITLEYIQQFYDKYVKGGSLLVFIQDPDSLGDISKLNKNIQILSDIKDVQGAEWDYVISDYNLDINGKSHGDFYYKLRSLYTLLTRHRHGFISFSDITWKLDGRTHNANATTNSERVSRVPIESGILNNKEALDKLKAYKQKIFDNIKFKDSTQDQEADSDTNGPKVESVNSVTIKNRSLAQIATSFVPKADFDKDFISSLELEGMDYNIVRNIIYTMVTDPNKRDEYRSKLPKSLQNGVFLIKFMDSKTEMLMPFGNKYDKGLDLNGRHPWLIYKIGDKDIHLGMFHKTSTSATITGKASKTSEVINSLEPFDLGYDPTYYNIPSELNISRSTNIVDILNTSTESDDYQGLSYKDGRLVVQTADGSLSQFESTPAFYFRKGIVSNVVNTDDILDTLSNIEALYEEIFNLINPSKKDLFKGYEEDIKQLLGISADKKSWKKRGVPLLRNKFISFVSLKDGINNYSGIIGLKNAAKSYSNTLKAKRDQLNRILSILKDNTINDDDKRSAVTSELDNKIMFDVAPLAFDREMALDKNDLSRVIDLINNDKLPGSSRSRSSYNNAVLHQFSVVLSKIAALYKFKDSLKLGNDEKYFNNNDADYLIKKINDRAKDLISDYKIWSGTTTDVDINTVIDFLLQAISTIYKDGKKINIKCFDNNGNNILQTDSFKDLLIDIYTDPNWNRLNAKLQGLRYKKGDERQLMYFKDWNSTYIIADNGIDVLKDGDNIALAENDYFSLKTKILQVGGIYVYGNENLNKSMFAKYEENEVVHVDEHENNNEEPEVKNDEKIVVNDLWNNNKDVLKNFNRTINRWNWMRKQIKDLLQLIYNEDASAGNMVFEIIKMLSTNNIDEARRLLYSFNMDNLSESIRSSITSLQTTLETAYPNLNC